MKYDLVCKFEPQVGGKNVLYGARYLATIFGVLPRVGEHVSIEGFPEPFFVSDVVHHLYPEDDSAAYTVYTTRKIFPGTLTELDSFFADTIFTKEV